jgi:diguanylate cyclase (GGDEF)-like protein
MARYGALLFGAAAVVTALGLLLPHQAQANEGGLAVVALAAAAVSLTMAVGRNRLALWGFELAVSVGTLLVSASLIFNGERDGGAAGGDEVYYLWIALYSAHYFSRRALALQTVLIAVAYAGALYAIDPGPIAVSRWLTMIGMVVGTAVIVRILSERNRQLVSDLDTTARTDRLTGLANRLAFEERFSDEIARCEREEQPLSLLLGDVDRLKEINDRWGHAAGDTALVRVGRALSAGLRAGDTAARVGGDEFAILLPGLEGAAAAAVSARLATLVREASKEPTCTVALTVGLATFPAHGRTPTDLMRVADMALYAAKPPRARDGAGESEPVAPWRRVDPQPHYTF